MEDSAVAYEELQAWVCTPEDAYMLGIVKNSIGWVDEKNLQRMAERMDGFIYFFVKVIKTMDV